MGVFMAAIQHVAECKGINTCLLIEVRKIFNGKQYQGCLCASDPRKGIEYFPLFLISIMVFCL